MTQSASIAIDLSGAPGTAARPRSNSYNLVPVLDVPRPGPGLCPLLHDRRTRADGGRSLVIRLRDRMRLVRTATADFSDDELSVTRDRLGQIYADVSTKLAPDDFARDLRKLQPSAEAASCPGRAECAGCWEGVAADVFRRDDARVRAILAELTGRVLDVGVGEGGYFEGLAVRATAGALAYVGVDPDEARLAVLAARFPAARLVAGVAEALPDDLGDFDHVLFLRSYNHLLDPARALAGALAHLRPGGSLLLVDNVAFGLVRSSVHAARAEAAPQNLLEHYRNDGAAEADAAVRAAAARLDRALRLVERHDVAPATSNQWLLRYQ